MKKILKSRIFIFVITAIIFSGIGVYAESRYRAEEITYKTDTTETVNDALNALYKKNNLKKINSNIEFISNVLNTDYTIEKSGLYNIVIFTNSWNPKLKINGEEMYIKAFYSTGGSPDNIYFSTMIYLNKDDIVSVENKRMHGLQYYEI